jgi:hypothetical protein
MTTILPTGNPFVDTGMYAMQAKAREDFDWRPGDDWTPQLVEKVLGDGVDLAKANRHLNSFTMVCTTNSALVNPSVNKRMYATGNRGYLDGQDEGWKMYLQTLIQLRDELLKQDLNATPDCESCGDRPATRMLERIGRDYFPLAGSLGNDAQALPAASRSPRVCAFCLLAIQWIPLGATMFKGSLACFQFTEPLLSFHFVHETYRETKRRLETAGVKDKVLVPGSGEGATPAALFLLKRMRELQDDRIMLELPLYVSLNIWSFTNSGASPDCSVTEIHNPALQFLWETARSHPGEVEGLLKREDRKKPYTHLLTAIESRKDYGGFYPQKGRKNVADQQLTSKILYELYQTRVLARPLAALRAAERLAAQVYVQLSTGDKNDKKLLAAILKENPRWTKDQKVRPQLRRRFAKLAEDGLLTLDEYVRLFPATNPAELPGATPEQAEAFWREPGRAIRVATDGWDIFWFYLHHAACEAQQTPEAIKLKHGVNEIEGDLAMFTNPKIKTFARDIFDYYLEQKGGDDRARGLRFIKRNIVDAFTQGKVTNGMVRRWFGNLTEMHPEYAPEDWDALSRDELGRDATGELRFQLRLEIANLYRQAQQALKENEILTRS